MATGRRLAAILAAEMAGYSRLMGADHEGTHGRLKAYLHQLVDPKIEENRGRVVKNTGDGLLAEFSSVIDAVRCAVEIRRKIMDRNADIPEDKCITFRIGINIGDVIVEPDDIFGDGVDIAVRLEGLAKPGGICVSRIVRDQVRNKLPLFVQRHGEKSIKNIASPIRVYAMNAAAAAQLTSSPTSAIAIEKITSSNPPRLSIVVPPFANLSNDPEQEYFADGTRGPKQITLYIYIF